MTKEAIENHLASQKAKENDGNNSMLNTNAALNKSIDREKHMDPIDEEEKEDHISINNIRFRIKEKSDRNKSLNSLEENANLMKTREKRSHSSNQAPIFAQSTYQRNLTSRDISSMHAEAVDFDEHSQKSSIRDLGAKLAENMSKTTYEKNPLQRYQNSNPNSPSKDNQNQDV